MEMIGVPVARGFRKGEPRQSLEQQRQGDLHFQPGQGCPDAEMDAGAEADLGVGVSAGNEAVWFGVKQM